VAIEANLPILAVPLLHSFWFVLPVNNNTTFKKNILVFSYLISACDSIFFKHAKYIIECVLSSTAMTTLEAETIINF